MAKQDLDLCCAGVQRGHPLASKTGRLLGNSFANSG